MKTVFQQVLGTLDSAVFGEVKRPDFWVYWSERPKPSVQHLESGAVATGEPAHNNDRKLAAGRTSVAGIAGAPIASRSMLLAEPVGQVAAFAGGERGLLDLLAADLPQTPVHGRAGKSIKTTDAFWCRRSKTICFPSGVMSNVRIVDRSLNRVKRRVLMVPKSNRQKSCHRPASAPCMYANPRPSGKKRSRSPSRSVRIAGILTGVPSGRTARSGAKVKTLGPE
jgi:hypothetical protein